MNTHYPLAYGNFCGQHGHATLPTNVQDSNTQYMLTQTAGWCTVNISYMELEELLNFLNWKALSSDCLPTLCNMKVTNKLPACFHVELIGQAGCLPHPHQTSVGHLFWRNKLFDSK
jgi:hypothetical protein